MNILKLYKILNEGSPSIFAEEEMVDEMAMIVGNLDTAIRDVVDANPNLQGNELKRVIRSDADVRNALAGDKLHDQINLAGVGALVVHRDDVGVRQGGSRTGLANKAFDKDRVAGHAGVHDLQGHAALQSRIRAFIDHSHATASDTRAHEVALIEHFSRQRSCGVVHCLSLKIKAVLAGARHRGRSRVRHCQVVAPRVMSWRNLPTSG